MSTTTSYEFMQNYFADLVEVYYLILYSDIVQRGLNKIKGYIPEEVVTFFSDINLYEPLLEKENEKREK